MSEQQAPYGEYGYGNSPVTKQEPGLRRHIGVLRRHFWIVMLVFVIVGTLGVLRAYRAVPIYTATAKILVERQMPRVTQFEDVVQPSVEWWGEDYYRTQEEILKSRVVLELALENPLLKDVFATRPGGPAKRSFIASIRQTIAAALGVPPSTPPETWERLRGYLTAKHVNGTHFVTVRADSANADHARLMATSVAKAFVRYHTLRRLEINNDAYRFLQEQKLKEEAALRDAEQKLQRFREETSVSSIDSTDKDHPILKRLSLLNAELTERQLDRIELTAQYQVVKAALNPAGTGLSAENDQLFSVQMMQTDETVTQIRNALVAAEGERASLSDVYGPDHPRMQSAMSKVALLQTRLRESLNNIVANMDARLRVLAEEERELTARYNEQNDMALDLARDSLVFSRLANEVDRHRKLFQVIVERMSEVQMTSDFSKTNVEVVEEASRPKSPSGPNKMRMATTALVLGLLLGIGLVFLIEQIDDTVRTPEDLENFLGIPVLGFVPDIAARRNAGNRSSFKAMVTALEPDSSAIEAYRNIRTGLFFAPETENLRLLLVTSAGPGDGKTTTASNLALVIAQSGKRVLLIDSDFRRPRVHKIYGLDPAIGFSTILQNKCSLEEAVQKSVHDLEIIENLDILPAGPTPPNPTELLESPLLPQLLADWKMKYDRVIIDTPPVLFVSDTSILSTLSDGVILVVRSAKRTRAHAMRALKQIEKVKGRVIGGILNGVKVSRMGHYYSSYYYHGYARYKSDYYSSYYADRDEKGHKHPRKNLRV